MRKFCYVFIFLIGILFFCLNLQVPFFSDDVYFVDCFKGCSFSDFVSRLFNRQIQLWIELNGRGINNLVWQLSIGGGELCYNIFVSLTFVFVCFLFINICLKDSVKDSFIPWILVVTSILYLSPASESNFFWAAGGCNYLFPVLMMLCFVWLLRKSTQKIFRPWLSIFVFIFCFMSGWTHEIFALPVSFALICYLIKEYNKNHLTKISWQQKCMIVAFWIGTLFIIVSPGTLFRLKGTTGGNEIPLAQSFIAKFLTSFKVFRYARCFYLLLILCFYLGVSKKNSLVQFVKNNAFFFISLLSSLGIIVVLGVGGRAVWGVEVFAMMIILKWVSFKLEVLKNNRSEIYKLTQYIGCIIVFIIVIHQSLLIKPFHDSWKTYLDVVEQCTQPGFSGTARMDDWHTDNCLINPFVAHPYDMMMEDMFMRNPLNCNVLRSDVYDYIYEKSSNMDTLSVMNIFGTILIPYSEYGKNNIERGNIYMNLKIVDENTKGGWLFVQWHKLLQRVLPGRYPVSVCVNTDHVDVVVVAGKKYYRFLKPICPIAREIESVKILSKK